MDQNGGDDDGYRAEGVGKYMQPDPIHVFVLVTMAMGVTVGVGLRIAGFRRCAWNGRG